MSQQTVRRKPREPRGGRCGTYWGYKDHQDDGTVPCRDCCEAMTQYAHHLRRRKTLGLPLDWTWPGELVPPKWADWEVRGAGAQFRAGLLMNA